jgi:glycosyltransferase involved in cell wall biosynthesis
MRILIWHVHGSWLTAFLQGRHTYLLPTVPDRGPDGLGRARTWDWPGSAVEVAPEAIRQAKPDIVVLQRPEELDLLERWTGLRAGIDLPAVYVEHNTPRGDVEEWRHPLAEQSRIPIVHVTRFNQAVWDCGRARTREIEHGVLDPGALWTGDLERLCMSINDPTDRWRVAGLDVAARVARELPTDVYGMNVELLAQKEPAFAEGRHADLTQAQLHQQMARHRAYLHTYRWTSLGLSLLEAMVLGSPVLVLAATAAPFAVPASAGLVTSDVDVLLATARRWMADHEEAAEHGRAARRAVLRNHGIDRFLGEWDSQLEGAA